MKKVLAKSVLFSAIALALGLASCKNNAPKEQPATDPDAALVAAAENNIKAHQEDIDALWEMEFGKDKKISNFYLAGDYVFLSTENGKAGELLWFYKDLKDNINFDAVPVCEGEELSFQGNALVIKGNDKTTYFETTEYDGFNQLFIVTEKDGKKVYTDGVADPYDETKAQAFIDKNSSEKVIKLADILNKWK